MSTGTVSNCPKCNAAVGGLDECPQCGVLISKWNLREDNVATGNVARYKIANATSTEFNWVILAIVCIVVTGIFFFIEHSQ